MRATTLPVGSKCPSRLRPGNVVRLTNVPDNYYNRSGFHSQGNLATIVETRRGNLALPPGYVRVAYVKWTDEPPLVEQWRTTDLEYVGRAVGAWR